MIPVGYIQSRLHALMDGHWAGSAPELAPPVEATLTALCGAYGADRALVTKRVLWRLSDLEPAAAVGVLRDVAPLHGWANSPVSVLVAKINAALNRAEDRLTPNPGPRESRGRSLSAGAPSQGAEALGPVLQAAAAAAAGVLDDSPEAAAALELDPEVWQSFAALCAEQLLQWEGLRAEVRPSYQLLRGHQIPFYVCQHKSNQLLLGDFGASAICLLITLKSRGFLTQNDTFVRSFYARTHARTTCFPWYMMRMVKSSIVHHILHHIHMCVDTALQYIPKPLLLSTASSIVTMAEAPLSLFSQPPDLASRCD